VEEWTAYGFSKWKQAFIPRFLGGEAGVRFVVSPSDLPDSGAWLVWSSKVTSELELKARKLGVALWRMEDGFIRSVGLGVDLVPPLSLVIDSRGIYYDATRSSDLEWLLQNAEFDHALLSRAKALITLLVSTGVTKYNVGKPSTPLVLPEGKRTLLVPGQVETDASIRLGSPRWRTNLELLQQVRADNPNAFIIYKPHPDVLAGGRAGKTHTRSAERYYDLQVTEVGMAELLAQVDEVHTLTSLAGFEALLRGVSVTTYGMPFYAGWGLTTDYLDCERRTRKLTLPQLVAATLILYPTYVDPDSGDRITPEMAIELLRRQLGKVKGPSLKTRFFRTLKRISGKQS
jgi:capsular polysaccharide export protein